MQIVRRRAIAVAEEFEQNTGRIRQGMRGEGGRMKAAEKTFRKMKRLSPLSFDAMNNDALRPLAAGRDTAYPPYGPGKMRSIFPG